jgi:hypothetical protein
MHDLHGVTNRVKACMPCHVGDINHDLIAAGHPRMYFEFAAFHAQMPHHWSDEKDRDPTKSAYGRTDFEASGWLVGQLMTAHASLELLAERAANTLDHWPEYAENDCAACHHDLQSKPAKALRRPGALSFGFAAAFSPSALEAYRRGNERDRMDKINKSLAQLQRSVSKPVHSPRGEIVKDAKDAAALLRPLLESSGGETFDSPRLREIFRSLLEASPANSDQATQQMLGLAALGRTMQDRGEYWQPGWSAAIDLIVQKMDRPRGYDPQAIQQRWNEFKRLRGLKGP